MNFKKIDAVLNLMIQLCAVVFVVGLLYTTISFGYQKNKENSVVEQPYEYLKSVKVVDVNGDTIIVEGGATCHIKREVKD